jgi:hypothetical protein
MSLDSYRPLSPLSLSLTSLCLDLCLSRRASASFTMGFWFQLTEKFTWTDAFAPGARELPYRIIHLSASVSATERPDWGPDWIDRSPCDTGPPCLCQDVQSFAIWAEQRLLASALIVWGPTRVAVGQRFFRRRVARGRRGLRVGGRHVVPCSERFAQRLGHLRAPHDGYHLVPCTGVTDFTVDGFRPRPAVGFDKRSPHDARVPRGVPDGQSTHRAGHGFGNARRRVFRRFVVKCGPGSRQRHPVAPLRSRRAHERDRGRARCPPSPSLRVLARPRAFARGGASLVAVVLRRHVGVPRGRPPPFRKHTPPGGQLATPRFARPSQQRGSPGPAVDRGWVVRRGHPRHAFANRAARELRPAYRGTGPIAPFTGGAAVVAGRRDVHSCGRRLPLHLPPAPVPVPAPPPDSSRGAPDGGRFG